METAFDMIYSNTVFADFGNSRVKILFDGNIVSVSYSQSDIESAFEQYISSGSSIIYSTVNKPQSDTIIEGLAKANIKSYDVEGLLTQQTFIDFSSVEGVGIDRKIGILGALSITSPPFITIDCGTMITINVVNDSAAFVGGAIMLGFSTMLKATHDYTAALPLLSSVLPEQNIGTNTSDAIKSGVYSAGLGGVLFFLEGLKNNGIIQSSDGIVITGGEGNILHEAMQNNIPNPLYYDKDLVLNGIVKLVSTWGNTL